MLFVLVCYKHAFIYEKSVYISFTHKEQQLEMLTHFIIPLAAAQEIHAPHVVMIIKKLEFYAFNSKANLDRNVNKCSMIQKHCKMPRDIPPLD